MIVICIVWSGDREQCTGLVAMRHAGTSHWHRAVKYDDLQNVSRATGTVRTAYSDTSSMGSEVNRTFVYSNIQLGRGHAILFNPLNPTGYVMLHQFNIQQLYVLPTLYLCVLYLCENKQ